MFPVCDCFMKLMQVARKTGKMIVTECPDWKRQRFMTSLAILPFPSIKGWKSTNFL